MPRSQNTPNSFLTYLAIIKQLGGVVSSVDIRKEIRRGGYPWKTPPKTDSIRRILVLMTARGLMRFHHEEDLVRNNLNVTVKYFELVNDDPSEWEKGWNY